MKVDLLIIATNKYIRFLQLLISNADTFFLKGQEATYFVFTNKDIQIESKRNVFKIDEIFSNPKFKQVF